MQCPGLAIVAEQRAVFSLRTSRTSLRPRSWKKILGVWFVLCLYVASSIGLPVDLLTAVLADSRLPVTAGCRCSAISRQLGRCCCAKGARVAAAGSLLQPRSCCARRGDSVLTSQRLTPAPKKSSQARGCCASRSAAAVGGCSSAKQADDRQVSLSGCPCGSEGGSPVYTCTEPRLLPPSPAIPSQEMVAQPYALRDETCPGQRQSPEVPPPRFRLLSV